MKFRNLLRRMNEEENEKQNDKSVLQNKSTLPAQKINDTDSSDEAPIETQADVLPELSDDITGESDINTGQSFIPMSELAFRLGYPASNKISSYFMHDESLNDEELSFWDTLSKTAESLLKEINASEDAIENCEEGKEIVPFSSDMCLKVYVTRDRLTAYGFIFPPIGSGNVLNIEQLISEANKEGVNYGIDNELLSKMATDGLMKVFILAKGKPARDGIDGKIIDLFSREKQISLSVDKDETVDFKNLNWLQKVNKGDEICKIIHPVPPEDGMNVNGTVLNGRVGKPPKLPIGKNIVENEDHTALIAEVSGQLSFTKGIFKVDQLLEIDGDIDNSVGNLDAIGSITVKGNVLDGFSVKATGDILVMGSVTGAELTAGGNIQIKSGINGGLRGKLTAGGTVTCKFIENCSVSAVGTVKSDSIVNSTVSSSDKVIVTAGRGVIIGSTITCLKGIEAKVIGNERNLLSKLTVGSDPKLAEELRILNKEVQELSRKVEDHEKNIHYLMKMETLDESRQVLLNRLKLDLSIMKMNLSKKTNRINILEEELKGENYQIIANQIFPPLSVTIGTVTQQFYTESRMSRIYKSNGEIVLGAK